ncbi:MAG: 23S rRNA (pseudouridine(1915)-N(3))-methyltransferase RlmH [Alphaproteobacteria bacterium]|nr:23S rRNA (pseudouridine(1915)-N(3))-methyltransferase RlmH [Alphaproteobacteria bacterium]
MRLTLISVGRLKSGPEKTLVDDYVSRFRKAGRALGFRGFDLIDVDSGGGLDAEGERLLAKLPKGARILRLDEHGEQMASKRFADHLARLRDQGTPDLVFLIGGAEGYSQAVRAAAPDTLAFGPQTWPHRLVKVMLAEQVYRAASLLAGLPYHKA